jgi:hypothetical protein
MPISGPMVTTSHNPEVIRTTWIGKSRASREVKLYSGSRLFSRVLGIGLMWCIDLTLTDSGLWSVLVLVIWNGVQYWSIVDFLPATSKWCQVPSITYELTSMTDIFLLNYFEHGSFQLRFEGPQLRSLYFFVISTQITVQKGVSPAWTAVDRHTLMTSSLTVSASFRTVVRSQNGVKLMDWVYTDCWEGNSFRIVI